MVTYSFISTGKECPPQASTSGHLAYWRGSGSPSFFSIFLSKKAAGEGGGLNLRSSQEGNQALHRQEKMGMSWVIPLHTSEEVSPNEQPQQRLHVALSSDARTHRTAACGLQYTQ